jgi:hypothetical protein
MTLSPFQYVPAAVAYYDSTDWVESIMHVLSTTASSDLDPLMPNMRLLTTFKVWFWYCLSMFLYFYIPDRSFTMTDLEMIVLSDNTTKVIQR